MSGSGFLYLADRGGGRERVIPHANAALSWTLSAPGALSVTIPARIARAYLMAGPNPVGMIWGRYVSPYLPDWGGVVTAAQWGPDVLELAFESFESLLRKRRMPRVYGQASAPAGALAYRAYRDVQSDDPIGITAFAADEFGDSISWEWRGGDLDEIFRQLVEASGQEYTVNANRELQWRVRLGQDKTGTVRLSAPQEITDYSYTVDLWTVVNDLEGTASDARYDDAVNAIRDHTDSIRTMGRRYQSSQRYERVVKGETLVAKVKADLRRLAWPAEVMQLTTANVGRCWERYHVADIVSVILPSANVVRQVRILARAVDVEAGVETLAVEVLHEEDGW